MTLEDTVVAEATDRVVVSNVEADLPLIGSTVGSTALAGSLIGSIVGFTIVLG